MMTFCNSIFSIFFATEAEQLHIFKKKDVIFKLLYALAILYYDIIILL